jgi:hypothetical protein
MYKQNNKSKYYEAPLIKVVSFTVEHGFVSSPNFKNEPAASLPSLEEVTESQNSLTGYF